MLSREIQITKSQEENEDIKTVYNKTLEELNKLKKLNEQCRCFEGRNEMNFENDGFDLENCLDKEKSFGQEEREIGNEEEKLRNEMVISTKIRPQQMKLSKKLSDFKNLLKLKSITKVINNSNRNSESQRQSVDERERMSKGSKHSKGDSPKKKEAKSSIKTTTFMNVVKYQSLDSEKAQSQNIGKNEDNYYNQNLENYTSNKTIGTNIDEYEIDYEDNNQNYNEINYEIEKNDYQRKTKKHNISYYSKSPTNNSMIGEEENNIQYNIPFPENSVFGTNISKYYQKIGGKNIQEYAHETENTEKDVLMETENSPVNRNLKFKNNLNSNNNDNDDPNNGNYNGESNADQQAKSIDYEYSYSYAQTNDGYQSNMKTNQKNLQPKNNKPSLFASVSEISEDKEKGKSLCDITLGSINSEINEKLKENTKNKDHISNEMELNKFNGNLKEDNFISYNQGSYSEDDYNPKD